MVGCGHGAGGGGVVSRRKELTLNDKLLGISAGLNGAHRRILEDTKRLEGMQEHLKHGNQELDAAVIAMFLTCIRSIQMEVNYLKTSEEE